MTTSGIWNHTESTPVSLAAQPMDASSSSGTDSSGGDSATISSNDFLTLLVTEMQNQDPTADTDPNEYINQLVNVNSLEQLISINQTLSDSLGTTTSSSGASQPASAQTPDSLSIPTNGLGNGSISPSVEAQTALASGNLSTPSRSGAAERVAHALSGGVGAL